MDVVGHLNETASFSSASYLTIAYVGLLMVVINGMLSVSALFNSI